MSTKEAVIEMIRQLPDDVTLHDILAALANRPVAAPRTEQHSVPDSDADLDYTLDELTDDEWALFVARGLAAELSDPRDDLYTLEDGKPSHDAG